MSKRGRGEGSKNMGNNGGEGSINKLGELWGSNKGLVMGGSKHLIMGGWGSRNLQGREGVGEGGGGG